MQDNLGPQFAEQIDTGLAEVKPSLVAKNILQSFGDAVGSVHNDAVRGLKNTGKAASSILTARWEGVL